MISNSLFTRLIPAVVLCAANVCATDIPEGGDAVYHQLQASTDAVIADLKPSLSGYLFEVVQQLRGATPATFVLDEGESDLSGALRPGQRYLLFLRRGRSGPQFAASYYSAVPLEVSETAAYADYIRSFVKVMGDRAALKPLLIRSAGWLVPYISYSSVADLAQLGLLAAADVSSLAKMADAGQITDSRAKAVIIGQMVKFQLTEWVPTLERLATDRGQAMLVRSRSIDALYQLNATAALRNVAATLEQDPSLHLRRKIADLGSRIR